MSLPIGRCRSSPGTVITPFLVGGPEVPVGTAGPTPRTPESVCSSGLVVTSVVARIHTLLHAVRF